MHFHGRGRRGKRQLPRRFLRKRGAAGERFLQTFSGLNSLSQSLTALTAPSGREPLARRESFRLKHKACGWERSPWGAVAQRLRGFESAEPEKTVKRSSRRTGVNLQFFPVEPSSLGLKGASSPFFVAPARRNRWHFSGSLLVSKENIPGYHLLPLRRAFPIVPLKQKAAAR